MTALYAHTSPLWICLSMAVFAAGGALIVGIFAMKALELFPDMKGSASSMSAAIRQLLAFLLVIASELMFDGTIKPVAVLLFAYMSIALIWYIKIERTRRTMVNMT